MILTIRFLLGTVAKMLPMISADMAKIKVVTVQMVIGVLEMQGVHILKKIIPCQQFTLASTIHKNSLRSSCSMKVTAKVDLEGLMLPLNMVFRMTIMNHLR